MNKVSQILEGLAQNRIEERMASGLSDLVLLRAMYVKDLYNAIKKGNQKALDKWVNDYKADPSNKEELSWYEDEKLDVKKLRKELAEQEAEYDRVHAQGRTVFGEGVKMYTEYKYHVMCDRGNGKPEVAAWYDDKKKADKEANFLRSKGYNVEIKVNEEVIDEGRYVKDKDRMKALKNVFKQARGWEVSKTNPYEYELGYISFDVADEIARYYDDSDPDDEYYLDEDEYEASDGRSDLDKFVKVLKSDSNISKFDVHIAEKLRDLVDEFNKGYKEA